MIAVAPIPATGLGAAINDRLRRAAAPRRIAKRSTQVVKTQRERGAALHIHQRQCNFPIEFVSFEKIQSGNECAFELG